MTTGADRPVIGVDEAGRGPAIGPMVVAGVAAPTMTAFQSDIEDSKALAPATRESITRRLHASDAIRIAMAVVPPRAIDDPAVSLTDLTTGAMASVIDALARPTFRCFVDAAGPKPDRFAARIRSNTRDSYDITATHRADERFPVVSAASIVAKVERDARIAELESEYGTIGSGYPSDPATRTFLETYVATNDTLPACARRSWKPCRKLLAAQSQRSFDEF